MPSWDAHVAVSRNIFGISEDIVEDINETIDKGMVHDLGRRMPGRPKVSSWLLDPDAAEEQVRKLRKAQEVVQDAVSRGPEWVRAFWLHHALDLLSCRLVAAYIVNADLKRHGENILKGVLAEFEPLPRDYKVRGGLESFKEEFRANFWKVLENPELKNWAAERAKETKEEWSAMDVQSYLSRGERKEWGHGAKSGRAHVEDSAGVATGGSGGDSLSIKITRSTSEAEIGADMSLIMRGWRNPKGGIHAPHVQGVLLRGGALVPPRLRAPPPAFMEFHKHGCPQGNEGRSGLFGQGRSRTVQAL